MKWYLSLKSKIILSFIGLVVLLGGITLWLVYSQLSANMKDGLIKKGEGIARTMAESSRHLILTENSIRLQEILESLKASDNEISYLYVSDRYHIVQAHTFEKSVPPDLLNLKPIATAELPQHFYIKTERDFIRHISVPIEQGKIGFISVGLSERYRRKWIAAMLRNIILGAIIGLIIGVAGMYILASVITASLRKLTRAAHQIGRGQFDIKVDIATRDEITELANAFNRMSADLKDYINRLNETENNLCRAKQMSAIGQMSAALAHEINNPLDGIQRSINLIRKSYQDDEVQMQLFELIVDGLKRIEHTVRQMLTYARYQPHFELADVNTVIEKVFGLMAGHIKENQIDAQLRLDKTLPPVRADADGMAQVISNLLLNAFDAIGQPDRAESASGRIIVQTGLVGDNKNLLQISFSDNGQGIPDGFKDKIFEPFVTTKAPGKGTGLGLAITKNIVEQHNGTIEVRSAVNGGTEFIIHLPTNVK